MTGTNLSCGSRSVAGWFAGLVVLTVASEYDEYQDKNKWQDHYWDYGFSVQAAGDYVPNRLSFSYQ